MSLYMHVNDWYSSRHKNQGMLKTLHVKPKLSVLNHGHSTMTPKLAYTKRIAQGSFRGRLHLKF